MLSIKDFLPAYEVENVTPFVQAAIDAAAKARTPLFFDNGRYVCGTLYLRSYSHLILDDGAVIVGSTDTSLYPDDTDFNQYIGEPHMDRAFIFSRGCHHITLEGGTIDGQGTLYDVMDVRPMMIRFVDCSYIDLHDMTLKDSAAWAGMYRGCDHVRFTHMNVSTAQSANGDGADFDCSRDVIISDCYFDTGDDSICLQASRVGGVTERVTVTNCIFKSRWALSRIGTSCVGEIRDCVFSNLVAYHTECSGFKIQTGEGGCIHDLRFSNVVMRDATRPVFITNNRHRFSLESADPLPYTSSIRRLSFSGFTCTYSPERGFVDDTGIVVMGDPCLVTEDITFTDFTFVCNGGGKKPSAPVPELAEDRPEFFVFTGTLPSYALYARHVKGLTVRDMRVRLFTPDEREAWAVDDCPDAEIDVK